MKIITNSSSNTWGLCEQKYCWKYEYGLRPQSKSFPMVVGSMFHEGIDYLLDNGMDEQSLDHAKHNILSIDNWEEDDTDALLYARFMLNRYHERYEMDGDPWVEVVSTEETMGIPLDNDWWLFGKVDGLVRDKDGDLWLLEHKTTYSVDDDFLEKVKLDGQITRYMLMVREVFGEAPDGVIYNVICRPRKYQRKGESTSDYLERNIEEYRTRPKEFIDRQWAYRDTSELNDEITNLNRITEEIDEASNRDFWTRNTGVCYMRQRKCPYTDLCKNGMKPHIISNYNQEPIHQELDLDDCLIPDNCNLPEED